MIINENIEIRWHSKNKKYYQSRGYIYTKMGDTFEVKLEDMSKGSGFNVDVLCDYCKENISSMTYNEYNRRKRQSIVQKDSCIKCEILKIKESNLINYGVEYIPQIPSVKRKISDAKKTEYNKIEDIFNKKHCILLTNDYVNRTQLLEFICLKHFDKGVQKTNYKNASRVDNICEYCLKELKRELFQHDFEYVKDVFKSYDMTLIEDSYKNAKTKMAYKCNKHPDTIQYIDLTHLLRNQGCVECCTIKISNENHWNWKGGSSGIYNYLRGHINEWKKDSISNSKYKCVISGKRFDDIHHLYSFNLIVDDVLKNLNMPIYDSVEKYTDSQLSQIVNETKILHNIYPLGVCLTSDIHILFHNIYGYGNNKPEQFEEFRARLKQGEFDNFLEDSDIQLAI